MQRLSVLCLVLAGCSFTLDNDAPELPLVGSPPSLSSLQKLNNGPVYSSAIVSGRDGAYWLVLQEDKKKLRVLRLSEPAAETEIDGDKFLIRWREFYTWTAGMAPEDPAQPTPATLQIQSAGDASSPKQLAMPLGIGTLAIGGSDDVFAYSPNKGLSMTYDLVRLDGKPKRSIPYIDPDGSDLGGAFFNGNAQIFFDRAPCVSPCATGGDSGDSLGLERRHMIAHYTDRERDVDMGLMPRRYFLYEPGGLGRHFAVEPGLMRRRFFTCSSDGVRVVPVEPNGTNPPLTLDDAPCASDLFSLLRVPQPDGSSDLELFYLIGHQLRRVPIDGSRAPERVLDHDVERVLAVYSPNLVLYSEDSADKYIYGVGDAWIGTWRFANRARLIYLTGDQKSVTWLENSAQSGGIGDLQFAPINGTSTKIARNVYEYDELGDGRLLVAGNHAFRGTQNRIVIADKDHTQLRWVVDQASQYGFIPGSSDLIVDVVTGASTADLVRVPIPAAPTDGGATP